MYFLGVLGKLITDAEDVIVNLQVIGDLEGSKTLGDLTLGLAPFMGQLRTMIFENSNLKKEQVTQSLIEELEHIIQQGVAHKQTLKTAISVAKARRA